MADFNLEYGPVTRSQQRRERDEDGEYDAYNDGGGPACPEHPNHPLVDCEMCQAEEDEEIQDDCIENELIAGDRVQLLSFEDQPEEFGVVISLDRTTAIVRVNGRPTLDDDLLREVPYDQIVRQ